MQAMRWRPLSSPGFLRSLGAPAISLGAIGASADAAQSMAKLAGGVLGEKREPEPVSGSR